MIRHLIGLSLFLTPSLLASVPGRAWPGETPMHWAYVKPVRPALPAVKDTTWPKKPIDLFVLSRLEKEGLMPSPMPDRPRLLRRVYLDLIGLPPTIAQVEAFVNDRRADAYERVVDELLASPQYGERWARHWLDLARYADSNGFQRDGFRTVWPYRDWVVDAFNRDMPFDQFTIEQIAGDLLPGATLSQRIATGFNRCTTANVEGGTDPEENRVQTVFDRVNTTATVWLGTTMACAQCHNHKYDPFSQKEYYRLFAYFNSTAMETTAKGKGAREFIGPSLALPLEPMPAVRRQQLQGRRLLLAKELVERTKKPKQDAGQQAELKSLRQKLADVDRQLADVEPATLVMIELPEPRPTHVLRRGNFLDKGKLVRPGTPEVLHPLAEDAPANRLALARWLVDGNNPLVGRVTVNRWWAEFFGHGLVATPEDFGSQCEPPTHPQLLDWLAVEFREHGWSMKHIHRLIVTSATYQQSSRLTPSLLQRDPDNELYARGPRLRLDAETIRDNALAVSGLLSRKMGGPPVLPPQPPGIWNVTGVVDNTYRTSQGEDRYRRGLYTLWRRSSPYASFVAFDAPDRASCVVKRPRTNTALQALTLLNDPVYVEAAVALARRIATDFAEMTVTERVAYGFRLCLARKPGGREIDLLKGVYERALAKYQADPAAAGTVLQNLAGAGSMDAAEVAAWFQVASVLLNLDEMITKG